MKGDYSKNIRICGLEYFFLFGISVILLFVRCFYGFSIELSDEFSQPAVIKRFLLGDRLLVDDWQPATTLIGYYLYCVVRAFGGMNFNILHLRFAYVVFQISTAFLFLCVLDRNRIESKISALAYLFSTPYGIMSICYNTVAISSFLLFVAFMVSDYKPWKRVCAGVCLSVSVLSIPHIAFIFVLYLVVTIINTAFKFEDCFFRMSEIKWMVSGIAILLIPFCIIVFTRGSLAEYYTNLKFILEDAEHTEYSIWIKLLRSHYQILRVYWRVWVPLTILCLVGIYLRKSIRAKMIIYVLTCLSVVYGTVRFAFVYGSVSINLMIVPVFFWGISSTVLARFWGVDLSMLHKEIVWLIVGYIFAVCDYLATNTEILSMSAMFIIASIGAVFINAKVYSLLNFSSKYFFFVAGIFVVCLAVLRMTYIWGDSFSLKYNEKIESGVAKGIYTSSINAQEYYEKQEIIARAELSDEDSVLIVPINPLYYISSKGAVASPYVFRFKTDLNELIEYYDNHLYKMPTKVIVFDTHTYFDIIEYFCDNGYTFTEKGSDYSILSICE